VLLLTGIIASGACAAPLAYNINFITDSGSPTPTGSFTYDSSLADGAQFSAFLVDWDGFTFDFMAVANSGGNMGCTLGASITIFNMMSDPAGACPGTPNMLQWGAGGFSINFQFRIWETPRAVTPSFFPAISLDQDRQRGHQVHGRSPGTTHPKPPSHPRSSWRWQAVHSCC
jgi:hypothetical protein